MKTKSHPSAAALFAGAINLLPRDTHEAAKLARMHDSHLKSRAWTRTDRNRRLQHVVEIRHTSFVTPAVVALLRKHDTDLVVVDTAGK